MDTTEQNKNTVTACIDTVFTKGDVGAVDEYLAEDFVNHDPPIGVPGRPGGDATGRGHVPGRVPGLAQRHGHPRRRG